MELDTDKRSTGDFENKIEWSGLNTLYREAMTTVAEGIKLTQDLINSKKEEMLLTGIDSETLDGIVLSFKDIKKEVESNRDSHVNKNGYINPDNFEEYSKYLELASKYQSLMENTATLISSSYMDVLNTAVMRADNKVVRVAAQEAYDGLKEAVDSSKDEEVKHIEGKLNGK